MSLSLLFLGQKNTATSTSAARCDSLDTKLVTLHLRRLLWIYLTLGKSPRSHCVLLLCLGNYPFGSFAATSLSAARCNSASYPAPCCLHDRDLACAQMCCRRSQCSFHNTRHSSIWICHPVHRSRGSSRNVKHPGWWVSTSSDVAFHSLYELHYLSHFRKPSTCHTSKPLEELQEMPHLKNSSRIVTLQLRSAILPSAIGRKRTQVVEQKDKKICHYEIRD